MNRLDLFNIMLKDPSIINSVRSLNQNLCKVVQVRETTQ